MLSIIPRSETAVRRGLTGLLLLAAPFLLGADDAYLREIEEEAKRQAAMLTVSPAPPRLAVPESPTEAATDRLASGLDHAAFEQALRETLPGTYALYQQFDPPRKQQVYEAYRNDNRLAGISEKVIQMLNTKP